MVRGAWMMMQQDTPSDFVLASGAAITVREFATQAFAVAGIDVDWSGAAENETGVDRKNGNIIVRIDKKYYRPTEVENLCGDYSRAKQILKWQPEISLADLIREMVFYDMKLVGTKA
jgi:GDPmannose 4,6-dehydratase